MKTIRVPGKPVEPRAFCIAAAAAICLGAGTAGAGEDGKTPDPAKEAKAEQAAEYAAQEESAKARPKESWASGASTTDPSPKGAAASTPTTPHEPVATAPADQSDTARPVSEEQLEEVVEEAKDEPATPKESWMRGKSSEDMSDSKDPSDR